METSSIVDRVEEIYKKSSFALQDKLLKQLYLLSNSGSTTRGDIVVGAIMSMSDLNLYAQSGILANKLAGEDVPPYKIENYQSAIVDWQGESIKPQSEIKKVIRDGLADTLDQIASETSAEPIEINSFEYSLQQSVSRFGNFLMSESFMTNLQELNLLTETEKGCIAEIRKTLADNEPPKSLLYIYMRVDLADVFDAVLNSNVKTPWDFRNYLIDKEKEAGFWDRQKVEDRTQTKQLEREKKSSKITKEFTTKAFVEAYKEVLENLKSMPDKSVALTQLLTAVDDAQKYLGETSVYKLNGEKVTDKYLEDNVWAFINAYNSSEEQPIRENVRGRLFKSYDDLLDKLKEEIEIRKGSRSDVRSITNGIYDGLSGLRKYIKGVTFIRKLRDDGVVTKEEERKLIEARNACETSDEWLSLVSSVEHGWGYVPLTQIYKKVLINVE